MLVSILGNMAHSVRVSVSNGFVRYVLAKQLNAANQQLFAQSLLSLLKSNLAEDEKDLEWFTLKFDYRNQSKPWGNSRNALERTINRLRGECIVNDAKEKE